MVVGGAGAACLSSVLPQLTIYQVVSIPAAADISPGVCTRNENSKDTSDQLTVARASSFRGWLTGELRELHDLHMFSRLELGG